MIYLLACLLNEQKVESGLEEGCLDAAALASLWPHSLIYKLGGGGMGREGSRAPFQVCVPIPSFCPGNAVTGLLILRNSKADDDKGDARWLYILRDLLETFQMHSPRVPTACGEAGSAQCGCSSVKPPCMLVPGEALQSCLVS